MFKATSFILNDTFTMARGIYFKTEGPSETLDLLFPWKYILSASSNHCNNKNNYMRTMLETVSMKAELNKYKATYFQ